MHVSKAQLLKYDGHYKMSSHRYLRPKDVTPENAKRILDSLNSLKTADELSSLIVDYAGQKVLSIRVAQRILNKKVELGRFQDLHQVATVQSIGTKTFTAIIYSLSK